MYIIIGQIPTSIS